MILSEIVGYNEDHPTYLTLEISNADRQLNFLKSIVTAAIEIEKPFLSQTVIKALNFHAITCLHTNAGEYRPCEVEVGTHKPPHYFRVQALMDDFVNTVNRYWDTVDPIAAAAYVLWRLNWIHPFINGNGRTARVACYYVLCLKLNGWLPGTVVLPDLIKKNRKAYVEALKLADKSFEAGKLDTSALIALLEKLLKEQLSTAKAN